MKSVELLVTEHRLIERVLRVLEVGVMSLKGAGTVPHRTLASVVEFLHSYVDTDHHGKEENILFPALAAHGITADASAIGALEAQHELGRSLVIVMNDSLKRITGGDTDARSMFAQSAHEYIELLRSHIAMEDQLFAEYAGDCFSPSEDADLRARMDELDLCRPAAERREDIEQMIAECEEMLKGC